MARSAFKGLLCVVCLASFLFVASAQRANHYKPRDPPLGLRSRFNPATKHFEPVTSDKSYTYYRLAINLNETFSDIFDPKPNDPIPIGTVAQIVASGDVFDNTTAAKVGTFDLSAVTTSLDANMKLQYIVTLAVELGPDGDDTIFVQAALDFANIEEAVRDYDCAVIGGTGRYKGATGEVTFTGTAATTIDSLHIAEVAVPKFKRF
uniref:Dirigent protein n=1 Tax=Tetradesmus obliquus TaxID=3088 RepID=A0A383WKV8_TETOB|eukprot:jgi/Sobl393_1/11739/SZX77852.1